MPWTFSHPAAVLPIHALIPRATSLLALVIGSIAPDLFYYVGAFKFATAAHTWTSFIWYCLPLGLLCFLILDLLWPSLRWFSPKCCRLKLSARAFLWRAPWLTNIAIILFSLILGSATHVFWDGFTHKKTWLSQFFPSLTEPFFLHIPLYSILQHSSTLLGLLAWACLFFFSEVQDLEENLAHDYQMIEQRRYRWYATLLIISSLIAFSIWIGYFTWAWILSHPESALFFLILTFTSTASLIFSVAAICFYRFYPPQY